MKVSFVGLLPLEGYHVQQKKNNIQQGGTAVSTYVCYDDEVLFVYNKDHSESFEVYEELSSKWPEWVKAVFNIFDKQYKEFVESE